MFTKVISEKNLGVTLQPNFYAMLYFLYEDRRLWKHFLADTVVKGRSVFPHTCRLANLETYFTTLINPDRLGRGIGLQTGIRSHADVFECLHHTFLLCPHEWFSFMWHIRVEAKVKVQYISFSAVFNKTTLTERAGVQHHHSIEQV